MEMCYEGALVMPSSYAVMSEEEMTYVEGGDLNTLKHNLRGLYSFIVDRMSKHFSGATVGAVLQRCGLSWATIGAMAGTYSQIAARVVGMITAVTKWLGQHAVIIGAIAGAAGVALLWNKKIF